MLEKFTRDSFLPYLGQTFRVRLGVDSTVELELSEVKEIGSGSKVRDPRFRQNPFSVLFRGPVEPSLEQSMYRVEHDEMGVIENLFMTPISANEDARYYEAVFN